MKSLFILLFSTLTLFSSTAFINSNELKAQLNDPNIIILDTTNKETFDKGHIPNAKMVNVANFRHQVGKYQLMNSPIEIEKELRSLGINNDSKVVIYGHNIGKELLKASYTALVLLTNGLKDVSILNGGFPEWVSEYEFDDLVSKTTSCSTVGNFIAKRNENILVDLEYVKSRVGIIPMIEARPLKFFNGSQKSPGVSRLGHIKGAKSSYWREKFDSEYKLKSDKALNSLYLTQNGLNADKEVITYCTGGLEASMNWYVLTQYLHFQDVKIYDASMRQWGNLKNTPMEK